MTIVTLGIGSGDMAAHQERMSRMFEPGSRIPTATGSWRTGKARNVLNLFRPSSASTFGLVVFSKRLDALAHAASVEAIRLSEHRTPRRAIDRKQKQEDEDHARQAKVRLVNKATFRP